MIKAGVVGGTGYSGVELLRLLAQHPQVELAVATSRQEAGRAVSAAYPSLRGRVDVAFSHPDKAPLAQCDVVFFATPNGVAMGEARALLDAGARVIDISADFRLKDVAEWERWYRMKHAAPELLAEAVYGLCEVNRAKIRSARVWWRIRAAIPRRSSWGCCRSWRRVQSTSSTSSQTRKPGSRALAASWARTSCTPWLLAILFLLALAALAALVRAAARTVRGARLCAVPLRTSQTVDFTTAGRVVLCLEGPRFTPQFRKLRFELRQPGGAEVSGHRILFRLVASGLSRARVTLRTYDLPMAGRYELVVRGLEPRDVDAPEHSVVFMLPHLVRTVAPRHRHHARGHAGHREPGVLPAVGPARGSLVRPQRRHRDRHVESRGPHAHATLTGVGRRGAHVARAGTFGRPDTCSRACPPSCWPPCPARCARSPTWTTAATSRTCCTPGSPCRPHGPQ